MAKAELKTTENSNSVSEFIGNVEEPKKSDSEIILKMMKEVTGEDPKMWGTSIVGFGKTYSKYASGREVEWFKMGFSPRKQNLTLYGLKFYNEPPLLKQLGKYKEGKGCIYINGLKDVNIDILRQLMEDAMK